MATSAEDRREQRARLLRENPGAVEVGEFVVTATGQVHGPAAYMASAAYAACRKRIEDGTHVLISAAPSGTHPLRLVGVILQTDYAAWLGARQLTGAGGVR